MAGAKSKSQTARKRTTSQTGCRTATLTSPSIGTNRNNDMDSMPASQPSESGVTKTRPSKTYSTRLVVEIPSKKAFVLASSSAPTTSAPPASQLSEISATRPRPSKTYSTRHRVKIPSQNMSKSPAQSPSQTTTNMMPETIHRSSPFGFLSVSSVYTRVDDFNSDDEDFGTPFQRDLEDSQASRMQGGDESRATSHDLIDPIDAGSMPVCHDSPFPSSHERDTSAPDLDIPNPVYYDGATPDRCNTPISDHDTSIPDRPNRPVSRSSEEPSSGDDGEGLKGGPFSVKEVEKIKAEYAAFDKRIAVLAREMGRSVSSIQKIGGRVSRVVNPRKTTAWNVFQSSYPANTDKSMNQADYTKNIVRPAYNELVKEHGGEGSEEWAAESARMIMEHTEAKAAISADIAKHGGEVAKVMVSYKKSSLKEFKHLAGLGVHCELTMLADNACSPAAHAQNGQLFGTAEMESYYKSRRDFKSHVGDAYTFILSAKAGTREVEQHKAQVSRQEREEAFKNPTKAKGRVSKMLIELFEPFVRWNAFPWLKLPQKLLAHNLKVDGVLPSARFRLLGSLSIDFYNVSEIQALYDALECGQIKVSERTHAELEDPGEGALVTDSDGRVLMTVASALEMVEAKKKQGVHKAAERAVARVQAVNRRVDVGIDGEELGEDSNGDSGKGLTAEGPSRTVGAGLSAPVTKGSRKRLPKDGDNTNGPRKKRSLVKSAEFISDSDESSPTAAGPLHPPAQDIVPWNPRLSVDNRTAVVTPLEYGTKMALPDVLTGVPFLPVSAPPVPPFTQVAATSNPFPMAEDLQIQNWGVLGLPTLNPSILQGPDFDKLVEQYRAGNIDFGFHT